MTPSRGRPRLANWFAGLVAGTSCGLLVLVFPTLGVVLVALAAIGVLRARPRLPGASGLLVGVGATMLVLLIRAQLACQAFNAVPNQGCVAPDITAYLALGGGSLVAGLLLSAVAIRRPSQA